MKHKIQALVLGLGLGVCATVGISAAAFADTTCYTGCEPTVTTEPVSPPVVPTTSSSSGLAFTGADIEGLAAVGAGALVTGGLLLRIRRRRAA